MCQSLFSALLASFLVVLSSFVVVIIIFKLGYQEFLRWPKMSVNYKKKLLFWNCVVYFFTSSLSLCVYFCFIVSQLSLCLSLYTNIIIFSFNIQSDTPQNVYK